MGLREKIWNSVAAVHDVDCKEIITPDGSRFLISFEVKLTRNEREHLAAMHPRTPNGYVRRAVRSGLRLFFRPDERGTDVD